MRVWNVIAWAGRAAPSSRTSGKRNKQGTPKTGLQDKKAAHGRETLASNTTTQLHPVRPVPDPCAPRAVLLQQNQSQPRTVGAPAPGANTCPTRSHRGGAPTTEPNPTPTRRSTRPGCERVPTPFAPRAVLLQQSQSQLRPVGAPAPGANACPPVRTEAVLLRGPTTTPHPNADNPPPTPPTPP